MFATFNDRSPLQNVSAVLADWATLAKALPAGHLKNRAYWAAVKAVEAAAAQTLAVIAATRGCDPVSVARSIVERRAAWY